MASNRAKWSEMKQKENSAQFNQKEDNEQMASVLGLSVEGLEALDKTIATDEATTDNEAYIKAFGMFDIDKNGTIDSSELPAVLDYLKEDIPESDMDTLVSQADLDGDGNIDYLEFVELMKAYKRLQAVARAMKAQRGHTALVTNTRVQTTDAISGNIAPILPPLRVPRNLQSRRHMRQTQMLRGRRTPHVLKDNLAATSIPALRRELSRTKGLVKNLDLQVKKGVQWVQQHCPVTNIRAQMYCKRWGMEKLNAQLTRLQNSRVSAAFHKWVDVTEMERCQELAERYLRWKGSRLMIHIFQNFMFMKMNSAWNTWTSATRAMILQEKIFNAILIEKMVRGLLARLRVRMIIRNNGAIPMQALWRGHVARKYVARLKWEKRRNEAALRIQLAYRSYIVRKFQKTAQAEQYRAWSVVNLQRVVRGHLARVRVRRIRRQRLELHATCLIQAWYRGCKARKYVHMLIIMREREAAATAIQTQWRAWRSRQYVARLRAAVEAAATEEQIRLKEERLAAARRRDAEKKAAATRIQQAQRAKVARQEAQRRREEKARQDAERAKAEAEAAAQRAKAEEEAEAARAREAAAKKMQATVRGHAARKEVAKKKTEIEEQQGSDNASLKIQRMTRSKLARNELARRKELERKAKEAIIKRKRDDAALRIQTQYRVYKGALAKHLQLRAEQALKEAERREAVLKLQSQMRKRRAQVLTKQRRVQQNAATKLQSQMRGALARSNLKEKVRVFHLFSVFFMCATRYSYIDHAKLQHTAASTIQAAERGKQQRTHMSRRKESSIKIQAMTRGKLSRKKGTKEALAALERAKQKKRLRVATGIQAAFRGQMGRLHAQILRDKKNQEKLALVAKQRVEAMKMRVAEQKRAAEEHRKEMALRIQRFFRGWKARAIAAKRQRDLKVAMEIARNEEESKRLAAQAEAERRKQAANLDLTKIKDDFEKKRQERKREQRRKEVEQQQLEQKRRHEAELAKLKRERDATMIQVWYRDLKDRWLAKKQMMEIEAARQRAIAEQRTRTDQLRKKAAEQREKLQELNEQVKRDKVVQQAKLDKTKRQIMDLTFKNTQLQEQKRQEAQKAELLKLQEEEKQLIKEEKQEKAAIWLQGIYRGSVAKKEVEELRKTHAAQMEAIRAKKNAETELARLRKRQEREVSAMRIQRVYRSHKDWQAYQKRLKLHKRNVEYAKKLHREREAASKIQSTFRGYRTRRELKAAIHRKMRLEKEQQKQEEALAIAAAKTNQDAEAAAHAATDTWVQYWDENSGAYYYFNERTQETSWENPDGTVTDGTATDLSIDNNAYAEGGVYNDGAYDESSYSTYDASYYGADATGYQDPNAYDQNAGYSDPNSGYYQDGSYDQNAGYEDPNAYAGYEGYDATGTEEWGNEWAQYTDEESGRSYYYNNVTGETQWYFIYAFCFSNHTLVLVVKIWSLCTCVHMQDLIEAAIASAHGLFFLCVYVLSHHMT